MIRSCLNQWLSKRDLVDLVDMMNSCLNCASESGLINLLHGLRDLVPHDYAICGLAERGRTGDFNFFKMLNVSYPEKWIKLYLTKKYNLCDPVFLANFSKLGLQQWTKTYKLNPPPSKFLHDARDFGLFDGYSFGMRNHSGDANHSCSLFSFSGKSIEQHERTNLILEYVMPHFHQALIRIANLGEDKEKKTSMEHISEREKEVLLLLKDGKNSWAVSTLLNISERTVNFHVGNIMRKLGAESRLHAVAIAAALKLIDLS